MEIWVKRKSVLASLLSIPLIIDTDMWVCVWQIIYAASLSKSPTSIYNMTLSLCAQISAAVLSTCVAMCSRVTISGEVIEIGVM